MSTAQMTRPQQAGTWGAIFPPEQVTEQQSALFVKKLLAVAVSNITYLRAIFPENAFGDRCLEDLNLKILRDDSSCPGACQVIKWVKGCFDALDKKYLKMLVIGIYTNPDDPDTVIESYTFKFSYDKNGSVDVYRNNKHISSAYSTAETKKATIRLLRTIIVLTQSLSSLPDNVMMTMKLLYYDDITPGDYEPPGFTCADTDNFNFEEEPMNIKVGDVQTPFHTVKLRIKTDGKQFTTVEGEGQGEGLPTESTQDSAKEVDVEELSQKDPVEDPIEEDTQKAKRRGRKRGSRSASHDVVEPAEADVAPEDTPAKPGEDAVDTTGSQIGSQTPIVSASQDDMGVRCPCGCNEDDGLMILCANCKFWQHGVCFMVLSEDAAPSRHICDMCAVPADDGMQGTDKNLYGLTEVAVQAMCLWRRALLACTEMTRVLVPNFGRRLGVEMTVGQGLVNRLMKEGFLKNPAKGKKLGKVVDKEKLQGGIEKYFQKMKMQENEDSILESGSMEVDVEIVDKKESKKANKRGRDVDKEIEQLTSRAEDISIAGSKHSSGHEDAVVPDGQRGRGKKRVKAMAEENLEFELSNSQDVSQDIDYSSSKAQRKRRKASVARKAIVV